MGRPSQPARLRYRGVVATLAALFAILAAPSIVVAHPLGNYTINHYAEVRIEPDRVLLDVVIDQAEIPTFQARQDFDLDADGLVSDEEIETGRIDACTSIASSIDLSAAGSRLPIVTLGAGLAFPPGVGGLPTMRQTCAFGAVLPTPIKDGASEISYADRSFPERLGWREIVAHGSSVTLAAVDGEVRDASVSERLTTYPADLIAIPLADQRLVVTATLGGPALPPFDVPDSQPLPGGELPAATQATAAPTAAPASAPAAAAPAAIPGGVAGAELPAIFRQADLTPIVLLVSLLTAAGLGAAHALTPGHGKTLMAAYLVGTRGTALHALGLGLSVSVSHTAGILLLAAVVVGLSDLVAPDAVVRGAPIVAAISIVLIGGWMLLGEVRRRRATERAAAAHSHRHGNDHDHHHAHGHDHEHGAASHTHTPAPGSTISWRSLFLLGLAGGLIPSTSALLILLGSIAAGRPAFGFVLVVAFGIGMAAVMGGVGLALVTARDRIERVEVGSGLGRLREAIPLAASVVVLSFGLFLTAQALGGTPAL